MLIDNQPKTVAICDTEPIAIEGMRWLLEPRPDLCLIGSETNLEGGLAMIVKLRPAVLLIDKAFGLHAVLDGIARSPGTAAVVWGASMQSAEAVRFMQAGARGVVRKTASLELLVECLGTVGAGRTWLEQALLRDPDRAPRSQRSCLTPREQEVLDLVEQGMKNKDIARQLAIRPGTVKIHLKHIFEKTGIHGRYGLALKCLKDKGLLAVSGF